MVRHWTGFGALQDKPGGIVMWTTLASFRSLVLVTSGGVIGFDPWVCYSTMWSGQILCSCSHSRSTPV